MGRHSVERGKRASTSVLKWPKFRPFASRGATRTDSADRTLFGDPSLNLFGGAAHC